MSEYGDLTPLVAGYRAKQFLTRALAYMAFEPFVTGKTLPNRQTKTMVFRRWNGDFDFATANMYLTEGVVPNAQSVTPEDVTLTLRQMGGLTKLTDVVEDCHPDDVGKEMFDILSEQGPRIIELDRFYALRAATNKYYAAVGDTARTDVNDPISTTLLEKVIRNLERNLTMKITTMAQTTPDFNTESIMAAYIAVGHIDLRHDIEALSGITLVKDYPKSVKTFEGEVGTYKNIRFILTSMTVPYANGGGAKGSMISTGGTLADVYPVFIFGKQAWDSVALKGQFAITPMMVSPKTINQSNPMGQFGFVSWKTMQGTIILTDSRCVLLEVAATEL